MSILRCNCAITEEFQTQQENKILKMANLGGEGHAERTTTLEWSHSKSILMKCDSLMGVAPVFFSVNVLLVMCSVLDNGWQVYKKTYHVLTMRLHRKTFD